MTSSDAIMLLSKCTEIFMLGFMKACEARAERSEAGKASIKYKDVARVVAHDPCLEFLSDLIPQIDDNGDDKDSPRKAKKARTSSKDAS